MNTAVTTRCVRTTSALSLFLQYAFLVTATVQFAGGVVIFFGLLVSPEEIGEEKPSLPFRIPYCQELREVKDRTGIPGGKLHAALRALKEQFRPVHPVRSQPSLLPPQGFEGVRHMSAGRTERL